MLSVLIADDEWIEREGISLLLERSPYEFQVYMAENGEEAMKCLEKNTVDILFTDIKMPFMDGLELLVQANQTYKGLKIVIFSAFADFDYAKTALENRVLHYFLKPIDPDEFQTVLAQVVEAVIWEQEESRRLQRPGTGAEDVMAAFLHKEGPPPEWLAKLLEGSETFRLQLYDIQDENETAIAAFYERVKDNFVLLRSIITVSEGIILLLLDEGEEGEQAVMEFLESCNIRQACVVMGKEAGSCGELQDSFLRMEEMLRFHFFMDGNQLLHWNESNKASGNSEQIIERIIKEIYYGVDNNNLPYVTENLKLLREELRSHIMDSQIYVKYLYSNILKRMFDNSRIPYGDFKTHLDKLFQENSLSGIHKMILTLTVQFMEAHKAEEAGGSEQKKVIRSVIEIVELRYQEDISLQSIAEEVYLSPSYLSYLFKKEVGVSLIKYITMTRLDKAKELLLSGNMKIAEVAAKVGYQNYSYFNITFKNNVGISPAQFREHGR